MTLTPAYSFKNIRFCTLAGAESVEFSRDSISGRFVADPNRFLGLRNKRLFEEFANWPGDPAGVLRFTRRFGPLMKKAEPRTSFRFHCDTWKDDQEGLRFLWELVHTEPLPSATGSWVKTSGGEFNEVVRFDGAGGWRLVADASDRWEYVGGVLVYNTANLFRLMVLEMLAVPRERLRTCARPDCPHRFFVARHLKQNYCSDMCAAWGQRQWKQKWWAEHGDEWRKQHAKGRRKNVTLKTR